MDPHAEQSQEQSPRPRRDLPTGASAAQTPRAVPATNGTTRRPTGELRELFWQNVIQEMLTSLSMLSMQIEARKSAQRRNPGTIIIDTPGGTITSQPQDESGEQESSDEALFDGRLAVITTQGTRIPIAEVHPLFACGVASNNGDRALSNAVECTVFQISTPPGEVYTLPLSEIRGFHSLSPELVQKLQAQAEAQMQFARRAEGETDQPFGFAAFTSLSRDEREEAEATGSDGLYEPTPTPDHNS
ncbi:MAG: hypothetical protein Phyf2KO_16470 [Phycisphaerales bacterium]